MLKNNTMQQNKVKNLSTSSCSCLRATHSSPGFLSTLGGDVVVLTTVVYWWVVMKRQHFVLACRALGLPFTAYNNMIIGLHYNSLHFIERNEWFEEQETQLHVQNDELMCRIWSIITLCDWSEIPETPFFEVQAGFSELIFFSVSKYWNGSLPKT